MEKEAAPVLSDFTEGYIGKVQIRKSGKVQLVIGDVTMDVSEGAAFSFLQVRLHTLLDRWKSVNVYTCISVYTSSTAVLILEATVLHVWVLFSRKNDCCGALMCVLQSGLEKTPTLWTRFYVYSFIATGVCPAHGGSDRGHDGAWGRQTQAGVFP